MVTRLPLIALLSLAACAPFQDCPREQVICDPAAKRCICDRPTASLPDAVRGERDTRPEPQKPHGPAYPGPEGPEHPGPEPRREDDPAAHDRWEDRYDAWKEAGGIWP